MVPDGFVTEWPVKSRVRLGQPESGGVRKRGASLRFTVSCNTVTTTEEEVAPHERGVRTKGGRAEMIPNISNQRFFQAGERLRLKRRGCGFIILSLPSVQPHHAPSFCSSRLFISLAGFQDVPINLSASRVDTSLSLWPPSTSSTSSPLLLLLHHSGLCRPWSGHTGSHLLSASSSLHRHLAGFLPLTC